MKKNQKIVSVVLCTALLSFTTAFADEEGFRVESSCSGDWIEQPKQGPGVCFDGQYLSSTNGVNVFKLSAIGPENTTARQNDNIIRVTCNTGYRWSDTIATNNRSGTDVVRRVGKCCPNATPQFTCTGTNCSCK